jgi:hypothetical protein
MLVIFSTLRVSSEDEVWIDAVRAEHDPQHAFVGPHFTFVFPFAEASAALVLSHAAPIARETAPIDFVLAKVAAVKDPLGPLSHLFLLPTLGAEPMHGLHDRLHSGPLAQHRHPTLAFDPHVTVGAFERHEEAEQAAAALPASEIAGRLEALHVARFDGESLTLLRSLPFEG